MPCTAAPCIWLSMRSGLAGKPQSTAICTSGTRTVPSSSTFTWADRGDIGEEAAMHGEPEPLPFRQLLAPAESFSQASSTTSGEPAGVVREGLVIRIAVVPEVFRHAGRLRIDDPGRADQLQKHVLLVPAELVRQLRREGLNGPGARGML